MDALTLVVDAPTLIARIHGLKQGIYDGAIRLVVPACCECLLHHTKHARSKPCAALEEVEIQYKASLIPKDAPKESAAKRATGRASRREEKPLFDLNPRTAWEFLSRATGPAHDDDSRLEFQKENEEFSHWKRRDGVNEPKLLNDVLPPPPPQPPSPPPPSSFAEALLRKLNITDGLNPSVAKGTLEGSSI